MYKVVLKGGQGMIYWQSDYWYGGSGGILTAYKQIPKGVTLTVKSIGGGSWSNGYGASNHGGSGYALWESGRDVPVLAVGGGGSSGNSGGGGFVGNGNGYNWKGATGSSGVSCDGKCTANGSSNGGYGYCESDYSCIGTNGGNTGKPARASVAVYFCGPALSSPCP